MTGPGLGETLEQMAAAQGKAGGGAPGAGAPGSGGGAPGSGQPAGGQPPPAGAQPPAEPQRLDVEGLPPELKGRTPQEVSEIWGLMRQAVSAAAYARNLTPEPAAPPPPPKPAGPSKPFKEVFAENPEAALTEWAQRQYGPLFTQLATSGQEAIYASMREQYGDDFRSSEPQVREVLKRAGVGAQNVSKDNLVAAYYMVKGIQAQGTARAGERANAAGAAAAVSVTPAPGPPPPASPDIAPIDQEIGRRMGFVKQDGSFDAEGYVGWRDADLNKTLKVPTAPKGYGPSNTEKK